MKMVYIMTSVVLEEQLGHITRIAGSVIFIEGFKEISTNQLVRIGEEKILGEIVEIRGKIAVVQAYEDTLGLRVGDVAINTGAPFYSTLGPGLLGSVIDGIQRPLETLKTYEGMFLKRGTNVDMFMDNNSRNKIHFTPVVNINDKVRQGSKIGWVKEKKFIHPILYPPNLEPTIVADIAKEGEYDPESIVATFKNNYKLGFYQKWPIRIPRPYKKRLETKKPFLTGLRVIDTFFPLFLGGTAAISGGFGTGKTVFQQSIAKHANVDIVVFVLIGERGNEVSTVLNEFRELKDEDGAPLLDRTVTIVNTSNMPVAARESSIYLGMTIAEYYRDLGYNIAVLTDSTSRWAEAVREISGRLEEIPGEVGYPSYMSTQLGKIIERAGNVELFENKNLASITYIGAVSPPGGDFSEPVTQAALRVVGTFWAINTELAHARHYPAVDWRVSYSYYAESIAREMDNQFENWSRQRTLFLKILKEEEELEKTVRLLGRDSLSEEQKCVLDMATFLKRVFLQQNAYDDVDRKTSLKKQALMLEVLEYSWDWLNQSIKSGKTTDEFFALPQVRKIERIHEIPEESLMNFEKILDEIKASSRGIKDE